MADLERIEFVADGTESTWKVPRHVPGTLRVRIRAGNGGRGGASLTGGNGGAGGDLSAEVTIASRTNLTIRPGEPGEDYHDPSNGPGLGGWPDGGDGYGRLAGGGGGSTEILASASTIAQVGAGGGGGSHPSPSVTSGNGGDAGSGLTANGGDGDDGGGSVNNGDGGGGATTAAVGAGAPRNGADGSGSNGGDGGEGGESGPSARMGGGGGGGGYFGGGGGGGSIVNFNAGGGGAGSTWSDNTIFDTWTGDSIDAPDGVTTEGYVVFEWEPKQGGWKVGSL